MKKEQEKEMNIVFLLDRSGSMSGMEKDTIGGYNSYIKKELKNNTKVTTVLFDDKYEIIENNTPVKKVKLLNENTYYVRGCTALLDALGKSILNMERLKKDKVLFVITTDGYENASTEFTKDKIKKLIKKHENWEFIYIGADIDSYAEGESIGIKRNNIASFVKDRRGMKTLFNSVEKASCCYREEASLEESWKEDLDDYINRNKKN